MGGRDVVREQVDREPRGAGQGVGGDAALDLRESLAGVLAVVGDKGSLCDMAVLLDPQHRPGRGDAVGDAEGFGQFEDSERGVHRSGRVSPGKPVLSIADEGGRRLRGRS